MHAQGAVKTHKMCFSKLPMELQWNFSQVCGSKSKACSVIPRLYLSFISDFLLDLVEVG